MARPSCSLVVMNFGEVRARYDNNGAVRIEQTFAQHTLPDHAGGAEQDDCHDVMKASGPALMAAPSVVGVATPLGRSNRSQARQQAQHVEDLSKSVGLTPAGSVARRQ